MFTMTATKSSTCPLSGLTIEPGDTITRTGSKYTPWSLTNSEILRKRRIASFTMPTPEPSGICPICLGDTYPGDRFCADCGTRRETLHPDYRPGDVDYDERTKWPEPEQMATSAKQERKERRDKQEDAELPTGITSVSTLTFNADNRTATLTPAKAMLGFSRPGRDVVIQEPTPEPITPQIAPESRTDGKAVVQGETLAKAVKQITKPLAKSVPKKMRDTCPGLAYVAVTLSPDGSTVATTIPTDADNPIEPIRFPLVGYTGSPIAVVLDYDNATILAGILDPKTDATITVENIPRVLNPDFSPKYFGDRDNSISGMHLVISQTDKAGCRSRTRIKLAPEANTVSQPVAA